MKLVCFWTLLLDTFYKHDIKNTYWKVVVTNNDLWGLKKKKTWLLIVDLDCRPAGRLHVYCPPCHLDQCQLTDLPLHHSTAYKSLLSAAQVI